MKDLSDMMIQLGQRAKAASKVLALTNSGDKNRALANAASALFDSEQEILEANAKDMAAAKEKGLSEAMLDRLLLNKTRIASMVDGIEKIIRQPDPVGEIMSKWTRPNGLRIKRVRTPLGVIGIIYESRPNVTADAGALCIKSGNAVILRGGSESYHSSAQIHQCLVAGLDKVGLPVDAIQLVPTTDRAAVGFLLSGMAEYIDVVVPRGGKNLIARVQSDARVPVIGHLDGICHLYVHESADADMAAEIAVNAKMRRTGICGAAETLLIDKQCLDTHLLVITNALIDAECELRGDESVCAKDPRVRLAQAEDWDTEYLDAILSIRSVDDIDQAIQHISDHGSGHTESIIADNLHAAKRFQSHVDSAIVLHNASTQFADGGEFGMGAEIGIATGKVHARGPVGAQQLTSFKYLVQGMGHIRRI